MATFWAPVPGGQQVATPALGGRRAGGRPPFGSPLQEAHRGGPLDPPSFSLRGAAFCPEERSKILPVGRISMQ